MENVMLYCTGNKYENFLIDSQSFTKNRCILQATRCPKICLITLCKSEHMNKIEGNETKIFNQLHTMVVRPTFCSIQTGQAHRPFSVADIQQ